MIFYLLIMIFKIIFLFFIPLWLLIPLYRMVIFYPLLLFPFCLFFSWELFIFLAFFFLNLLFFSLAFHFFHNVFLISLKLLQLTWLFSMLIILPIIITFYLPCYPLICSVARIRVRLLNYLCFGLVFILEDHVFIKWIFIRLIFWLPTFLLRISSIANIIW